MGYQKRDEFGAEWHHVTNRGARKQSTFADDHDRRVFLGIVDRAAARTDVEVMAYCLMGNHYHLVIHAEPEELAAFMQYLGAVYTRAYNHRHGFDGALFRGRYYAKGILSDAQLLATVRYVHRNPLDIAGVIDIEDYRWSSHRWYAAPVRGPLWLKCAMVLGLAGGREAFREFVANDVDTDRTVTRRKAA